MTPLGWSPLAGGRLGMSVDDARAQAQTNSNDNEAQRLLATVIKLDELATRHEVSRAALAIAWAMAVRCAGV